MEKLLLECGFSHVSNNEDVLERRLDPDEDAALIYELGVYEVDEVVIQYDTANDTASLFVDGDLYSISNAELERVFRGEVVME